LADNNHVTISVRVPRELADDLQRYLTKTRQKKAHVLRRVLRLLVGGDLDNKMLH
jgi:hypothetical protein